VLRQRALRERTEILGAPALHLALASDQPLALVVARLCDVVRTGRRPA